MRRVFLEYDLEGDERENLSSKDFRRFVIWLP